mmetsp:Transcript_62254/g.184159  ORF Transcript_62254/g.184159 Transcript_62254/m.184159 type:complete len:107 (-) Transcript_62254:684-1004(-)
MCFAANSAVCFFLVGYDESHDAGISPRFEVHVTSLHWRYSSFAAPQYAEGPEPKEVFVLYLCDLLIDIGESAVGTILVFAWEDEEAYDEQSYEGNLRNISCRANLL